MKAKNQHFETLSDIRNLMERSTRFMSLSGSSGISIGILAIVCAAILYAYLGILPFQEKFISDAIEVQDVQWGMPVGFFILGLAGFCIVCALFLAYYFTSKKAKKENVQLAGRGLRLMIINLAIPLFVGGIFCLALIQQDAIILVAPATLIFYGLALINAGKYTLLDIHQLGLWEILLGIVALLVGHYNLEFWVIGFGLLHIIYGSKINAAQEKIKS